MLGQGSDLPLTGQPSPTILYVMIIYCLPYAPHYNHLYTCTSLNSCSHQLIFSRYFQVDMRQTLTKTSFIKHYQWLAITKLFPMRLLPSTDFVILWRIKYYDYKQIIVHIFHYKFIIYSAKHHTLSSSSLQSKLHIIKNIRFKIDSSIKESNIKEGKNRKNAAVCRFGGLEGTQA